MTLAVLTSTILLMLSVPSKVYAQENTASVEISGQTYDISYDITGGTVEAITADPATQTLLVAINSTSNGTLTVWLPTEVIDAPDDEFAVFIDGEFGNFVVDELDPTADARVLQIEFDSGAGEIEIVGTSMVSGEGPEGNTVPVEIAGQTYDIQYEITGGSVQNITADPNTQTLLVTTNST
ncbi:MAG TPA: hypothetical protein VLA68_05615, partial [Nitrososphaera sp.]|nr:hypothetical protein [Nitrososphaera sp.]